MPNDFAELFEIFAPAIIVRENGRICGRARVSPGVIVEGNAVIGGYAQVFGGRFKGEAKIGGFAKIYGGEWDGSEGGISDGEWDGPRKPRR